MIASKFSLARLKKPVRLQAIAVAGCILAASSIWAVAPASTGNWWAIAPPHARAQGSSIEYTQEQVNRYARSVLEIEEKRKATYDEIGALIGSGSVPSIVCNEGRGFNGLARDVRTLVVEYCTDSIAIVEEYGLSIDEFNGITSRVENDRELRQQIQRALQDML
ncbi:hypothetical protein KR51_00032460 [Rubidibacter lacunae KORDI 51-2]|uniref:DUF4168 domain-containing protein n=1 Tax=Rubidibacter lacunae KORDI 51-2 TaxID=582515 RepID=U5DKQ0_9CHRO|nr:DUF4168 domain-containing protein [Rubidibacter lacunae]ERN40300.1 hypothetical protein KR51_00032460 [Rubidibacter lacunae KORDI 51-2]